jgi:hypothetical protein
VVPLGGVAFARILIAVNRDEREARLKELAAQADAALCAGDDWMANELLRERRLVEDGGRDPEELLDEGMALVRLAADLAPSDSAGR